METSAKVDGIDTKTKLVETFVESFQSLHVSTIRTLKDSCCRDWRAAVMEISTPQDLHERCSLRLVRFLCAKRWKRWKVGDNWTHSIARVYEYSLAKISLIPTNKILNNIEEKFSRDLLLWNSFIKHRSRHRKTGSIFFIIALLLWQLVHSITIAYHHGASRFICNRVFSFCQVACRWFPWLKCSVFTSYVRAPATFSPAQQDRVQVARAERRWNTGVEHRITNVGVANNARSTVVAATGELETRWDRFGTPCSIDDVLISRYTCRDVSVSFSFLRWRSVNFAAGRLDPILKRLLCDASCFSREDFRKK